MFDLIQSIGRFSWICSPRVVGMRMEIGFRIQAVESWGEQLQLKPLNFHAIDQHCQG